MLIRNKSDVAREIGETGDYVEPGDTVDVPDEIANGTPSTGKKDSPDFHPGTSGLLAQEDVWEAADGSSRPSVKDVIADVGDDPDKARTALAVENESDKPRKTLVSHLEEIIASSEENA